MVVLPTTTDLVQDLKALSAAKEHTNEKRGGGRDPGVRRPMKREAAVAGLASEGLALVSGSAGAASSVVVVPTPADPVEFCKSTRDSEPQSAAKEHTNEARGGGGGPGITRPGAGLGQRWSS